MATSDGEPGTGRFDDIERELTELRDQLRRASEQPFRRGETRSLRLLEERIREVQGRLVQSLQQNERLVGMLQETRQQVTLLREEVEKLTAPPSGFGVFLGLNPDGTVNVFTGGRKLRVNVHPQIDPKLIVPGQEVMLNEALNVVESCGFEQAGEVVTLKEVIDGGERASIISRADEERIALIGEPLRDVPIKRRRPSPVRREVGLRPRASSPNPRSTSSSSKRSPTSPTRTSGVCREQIESDPRRRRASVHASGAVHRAQAARSEGRTALRTPGLRQDAHRESSR